MRYCLIFILLYSLAFNSFGQDGNLVSKTPIHISTTDLWDVISENGSLRAAYGYANHLSYSEIVYKSDSLNINGLLISPKAKGNYPVVIFNRGGNRDYNALTLKMLFFSTAVLANEGYIILASNYRTEDEYGGKDLNDVLHLIDVAGQIENADTSKIGMFGWSRGGMMTYMSLKESNRIKTAVIGNGASDLFLSIKNRPELEANVLSECIPNYWGNKTDELTKRSAIFWPDSLNKESSLLLLCGSLDAQVDYHQSVNMAAKLDAIGYECQVKVYETNHGFRGKRSELNDELIKWFDAHLKGVPKADYRKIAITIDDVPNTAMFHKDNYHSRLLEVLDSLRIPVSIFINEGLITKTGDVTKNLELLEDWVKKAYVAIGNHTFSHLRYSEVGYGPFKKDIEDGDVITRPLAIKFNKSLAYFRFPYNDLGIDSVQQVEIRNALNDLKYKIAPFTVESSDWMFNAVYEYYLTRADFKNARKIGELYVSKTVEYIHFFDSLSNAVYGRNTSQIYLCHDNRLNSDYLKEILGTLASEGYQFISMDEAIQDPVYNQENRYYKKWGISWFYRWMSTQEERRSWMELEPSLEEIEVLYKAVLNAK